MELQNLFSMLVLLEMIISFDKIFETLTQKFAIRDVNNFGT